MTLYTYKIANIHLALIKFHKQKGGYFAQGSTVQEAIHNVFTLAIVNI